MNQFGLFIASAGWRGSNYVLEGWSGGSEEVLVWLSYFRLKAEHLKHTVILLQSIPCLSREINQFSNIIVHSCHLLTFAYLLWMIIKYFISYLSWILYLPFFYSLLVSPSLTQHFLFISLFHSCSMYFSFSPSLTLVHTIILLSYIRADGPCSVLCLAAGAPPMELMALFGAGRLGQLFPHFIQFLMQINWLSVLNKLAPSLESWVSLF